MKSEWRKVYARAIIALGLQRSLVSSLIQLEHPRLVETERRKSSGDARCGIEKLSVTGK